MLLPDSNWKDNCGFPFRVQFFPPLLLGEAPVDIFVLIVLCLCTDLFACALTL